MLPFAASLALALACASSYERGEELYRQGALGEALDTWRSVPAGGSEFVRAQERLAEVEPIVRRQTRRFEKRARGFERDGHLANAVLYYRMLLRIDPDRRDVLERVQRLFREQRELEDKELAAIRAALEDGRLGIAAQHARNLEKINPYDPAIQVEVRQVRAAAGEEIQKRQAALNAAIKSGKHRSARTSAQRVLAIDPEDAKAQGILDVLQTRKTLSDRRKPLPDPAAATDPQLESLGLYRRGRALERQERPFVALDVYVEAVRRDPDNLAAQRRLRRLRNELRPRVEPLYERGKELFQDDDLQSALVAWQNVLRIDPEHERAKENADRARRILSRLEEIQESGEDDGAGSAR